MNPFDFNKNGKLDAFDMLIMDDINENSNPKDKDNNDDKYSELNDLEKEEIKKGNQDPWDFEEEDLEDDDYYSEDD